MLSIELKASSDSAAESNTLVTPAAEEKTAGLRLASVTSAWPSSA
jgi:hypothetical protein